MFTYFTKPGLIWLISVPRVIAHNDRSKEKQKNDTTFLLWIWCGLKTQGIIPENKLLLAIIKQWFFFWFFSCCPKTSIMINKFAWVSFFFPFHPIQQFWPSHSTLENFFNHKSRAFSFVMPLAIFLIEIFVEYLLWQARRLDKRAASPIQIDWSFLRSSGAMRKKLRVYHIKRLFRSLIAHEKWKNWMRFNEILSFCRFDWEFELKGQRFFFLLKFAYF